ncbi:Uncharacterised protein [Vibrio cholerae]|nr:Uncharacterised protein [Vibrio cholerae]
MSWLYRKKWLMHGFKSLSDTRHSSGAVTITAYCFPRLAACLRSK